MKTEPFVKGNYYHVYNRGNNSGDLFFEEDNYRYFLKLYKKYIDPVADTFAWCLMRNHFHLLVYLKEDHEINHEELTFSTIEKPKEINHSKQFSHLFNAYTQAINKRFNRTGSLFEKPFERKKITSEDYFSNLIFYIHNNPVHHGVEKRIQDYPWSSYGILASENPTTLKRERVISFYDDVNNFVYYHNTQHDCETIRDLLMDCEL